MDFINIALATIVALLPIANPFSTAALFVGITGDNTPEERRHQAFMGCVYMFGILTVFLVLGSAIMQFFGISIPGLRIAGGIMVVRIGMSMLTSDDIQVSAIEKREAVKKSDVSFTPLAMPSLSGPGAIAVTIGMASAVTRVTDYIAIVIGLFLVSVLCWTTLRASTTVVHYLGATGLNAITRVMGFLLLCVGIQFIVNGIVEIVTGEEFLRRIADVYSA